MEEVLELEAFLLLLLWSWVPSGWAQAAAQEPGDLEMRPVGPVGFQLPLRPSLRGVWELQSITGFKRLTRCLGSPALVVCDVYIRD